MPYFVLGGACGLYPVEIRAGSKGTQTNPPQVKSIDGKKGVKKDQDFKKGDGGKKNSALSAMSSDELLAFFRRVMQIVQAEHIDQVDPATLLEYALKGMLSALDPHSCYLDQCEYDRLKDSISGSFGGIGVVMTSDPRSGGMRVISCLDGTPADKAGILPGDMIVAVNDTLFTQSDGFFSMSEMMRGDPGTRVKVTIDRKGHPEMLNLWITRAIIAVQSVKCYVDGNIGMIRIANFDEKTPELLKKGIHDIQSQTKNKLLGYIIDLRRNSGGLVEQAIACSQLFIDRGVLLRARGRSGTDEEVTYAIPGLAIVQNIPIVVLIDQGTASAAEMMAGAMQDHNVAVILGTQSFGKGSTQVIIPVDARVGSAVKITGKRWYTPNGHPIQAQGITPDIIAEQVKAMEPLVAKSDFVMRESLFSNALSSENPVSDSGASAARSLDKKSGVDGKATIKADVKNQTPPQEKQSIRASDAPKSHQNNGGDPEQAGPASQEIRSDDTDSNSLYSGQFDYQLDCAKKLIAGMSLYTKQAKTRPRP
jgi:carboxyl-terminal processing protease